MFHIHHQGNDIVIALDSDRFDTNSLKAFRKAISKVQTLQSSQITIDLRKVRMIDSTAVGALLILQESLAPECAPLTLAHAQPPVAAMVELLRLHRVFNLQCSAGDE